MNLKENEEETLLIGQRVLYVNDIEEDDCSINVVRNTTTNGLELSFDVPFGSVSAVRINFLEITNNNSLIFLTKKFGIIVLLYFEHKKKLRVNSLEHFENTI